MGLTSAMIYRLKYTPSVTQNYYNCQQGGKKSHNYFKLLAYILVHRHVLKVSWFPFHWLVDHVKSRKSRNLATYLGNQPCTKITLGTDLNSMTTFKVP